MNCQLWKELLTNINIQYDPITCSYFTSQIKYNSNRLELIGTS